LNEAVAGDSVVITEAFSRKTTRSLFGILCYQGYAFAILGVGAPFIGKSFGLDQSGIARVYAWISLNSIGALALSRMADRIGLAGTSGVLAFYWGPPGKFGWPLLWLLVAHTWSSDHGAWRSW
jgi:hypothetical protein